MKRNKKVAVTGGIGSGKSTVCEIIKRKGFPVFSCDEIYSELLQDNSFIQVISAEFGKSIINGSGTLDRKELSSIVFNDEAKLQKLNKITHAEIFEEMFSRAEKFDEAVFFEVPLLFEGGYEKLFDEVVVILRNENDRISSILKRDNQSLENVKKRILKQYNYENQAFEQYYVIHNDGNFNNLEQKVEQMLTKLDIQN